MIRPAVPEDALALGTILSDWIDEMPWMPRLHSRDEDRGFCLHLVETMTVWAVQPDRQVLGFLARDGAEVPALYLAPEARGRGLGKALLDEAKAASDGCLRLWTFQANTDAIRFYRREGFAEVARTDGAGNDEKLSDLRLEWRV